MSRVNEHMVDAVVYDSCSFTARVIHWFLTLCLQSSCCVSLCAVSRILTPSGSGGTCTGQPPSCYTENPVLVASYMYFQGLEAEDWVASW